MHLNETIILFMNKQEFNKYIEKNKGYYLICFSFQELTEEQKKIAFNNAIENNLGGYLLIFCSELTKEQVKKCEEQI